MKSTLSALAALLLVAAVAAGIYAVHSYRAMSARVAELEQYRGAAEALSEQFVKRAEFDRAIRKARSEAATRIEKLANEDSPDGAYLRTRIPDGVRDAARTR